MNQKQLNFYIDINSLDHNFYSYEKNPSLINPEDLIADSLIMQSTLFNSAAYCLLISINQMQDQLFIFRTNENNKEQNELLLRYAYRDVCINSETYFEKIKVFTRHYFYICDKVKTSKDWSRPLNNEEWLESLSQFSSLNQPLFETLIFKCKSLINSESYKFIKKIRNDEIHNQSPLFLKKIDFGKNCSSGIMFIDKGFIIDNDVIEKSLNEIIVSLTNILELIQKTIEVVKPYPIAKFIELNKNELKYIIEYEKRYIRTRDFIQKYNKESH